MTCGCNSGLQSGGGPVGNGATGGQVHVAQPIMNGGNGYNQHHFAPGNQGGGGTRRRKHTRRSRRSGTRKTRGHGRKRACKCPGGCKRSTCPCRTGKRSCCTKRCRCLGARA